MQGTITTIDVLQHAVTIIRLWGPRAYLRCLRAALGRRPTTFLASLYEAGPGARRRTPRDGPERLAASGVR